MNVKEKSVNQLLKIDIQDFEKLSRSDLSKIVSKLGSVVNRRVKGLKQAGYNPPALRTLTRSGGNVYAKGKSVSELRREYTRAAKFLRASTSTKSGYEKFKKDIRKSLGDVGKKLTNRQLEKAISITNKLISASDKFDTGYPREILKEVVSIKDWTNKNQHDVIKILKARWEKEYEEQQRDRGAVSSYVDWDYDT